MVKFCKVTENNEFEIWSVCICGEGEEVREDVVVIIYDKNKRQIKIYEGEEGKAIIESWERR